MNLNTDRDDLDIEHLNELIDQYGLGPTIAVGVLPDTDMVQVVLDGRTRQRSVLLARWLGILTVRTMIAGKKEAGDPLLWLHLRGSLPGWPQACISMPYLEVQDAAHCAVIRDLIDQEPQDPVEMIDALSVLDKA